MMTYEEAEAAVRPFLSEKRFYHSVCVSREAENLARRYGADPVQAHLAGILHDIMKDLPRDEQLKLMERFGIILTDLERAQKKLWHAILGAAYIEKVLKVEDVELVRAVRYHTTGRADMTLLEKVIFLADFISADRNFPGVEDLRKKAYFSMDSAIAEGMIFTIRELAEHNQPIHPNTILAYNQLVLAGISAEIHP